MPITINILKPILNRILSIFSNWKTISKMIFSTMNLSIARNLHKISFYASTDRSVEGQFNKNIQVVRAVIMRTIACSKLANSCICNSKFYKPTKIALVLPRLPLLVAWKAACRARWFECIPALSEMFFVSSGIRWSGENLEPDNLKLYGVVCHSTQVKKPFYVWLGHTAIINVPML